MVVVVVLILVYDPFLSFRRFEFMLAPRASRSMVVVPGEAIVISSCTFLAINADVVAFVVLMMVMVVDLFIQGLVYSSGKSWPGLGSRFIGHSKFASSLGITFTLLPFMVQNGTQDYQYKRKRKELERETNS